MPRAATKPKPKPAARPAAPAAAPAPKSKPSKRKAEQDLHAEMPLVVPPTDTINLFPSDFPASDDDGNDSDDSEFSDIDSKASVNPRPFADDDDNEDDDDDEGEGEESSSSDEEAADIAGAPAAPGPLTFGRDAATKAVVPVHAPAASKTMVIDTSDSDTEDEEHARDGIGRIPKHWYDEEEHCGYDLNGKKIMKTAVQKDRLDRFLAKMDDPNFGRTLVDPITKQEILLSDEDVAMIKRIQAGQFPSGTIDEHEDYIDFFTYETRATPVSLAPEPKSRFVPSKHEHKRIMKMVRHIRRGWLKPNEPVVKAPEFFDIWEQPYTDNLRRRALEITAPKVPLPGHAESYNPPPEYLPTPEEIKAWEEMDPEDRPLNFLPKKYSSLRLVPAYNNYIQERFSRCLDLYLCPRMIKQKMNVDPEALIPKLPRPQDLQPFPTKLSLMFLGHKARVTCISVDPTGLWLASGSDDKTVRFWEVSTGRCMGTVELASEATSLAWNPNPAFHVLAVASGTLLQLYNPRLGSRRVVDGTDFLLKGRPAALQPSLLEWVAAPKGAAQGLRFTLTHKKNIEQVTWHHKGNYFATVMPSGVSDSVFIHALQRQTTQNPFSKKNREVQRVLFHPTQPILFVASKTHVRVYNLQSQTLVKKLLTGMRWVSSLAVHPKGDNLIVGSFDRRLAWFDLDLSVRPYKTLRYHREALRQVCFHPSYPLFASCSDDTTIHVFHGMVYNDLMQNPLIVPVKNLRGFHTADCDGLGVMDLCFHPRQPWLFSAGADGTVRLFT